MVCGSDDGDEYHGGVAEPQGRKKEFPEFRELGGTDGGAEEGDDGGVVDQC